MKLTVHMIDPHPTPGDPMAQRWHAALIWEADKELVEIGIDDVTDEKERAAYVALVIATGIFVTAGGGTITEAVPAMAAYAQKLLAMQRGA